MTVPPSETATRAVTPLPVHHRVRHGMRRPHNWSTQAWVPAAPSGFTPGANSWAYTNPFNPCKPFRSDRCHEHPPFDYYTGDQRPPIGPNPPVGYPGSHPATPNG